MLFFTPAWMKGDADEHALAAYQAHLQAIGRRLPIRVLDFIRTVSLHDGRIQRVCYGRGSPLVMLLRCGDARVGYYDLELTYHDLSLARSDLRSLAAICLAPAEELLYDEFDLVGDMVVHRILFSSLREVALVFRQMDHRVASASSRGFDRGVDDLEGIDAARTQHPTSAAAALAAQRQDAGPTRDRRHMPRSSCPCCRRLTLTERAAFMVCPVCFWQDDGQDDRDADVVRGGPNRSLSLTQARANFLSFGACDRSHLMSVRPPLPDEAP